MKINVDAERKVLEARREYDKKLLVDEKTGIEAKLTQVKEGTEEEFDLRKQLLFQQYKIEIENIHLTSNEREKLYHEYVRNLKKMNDDLELFSFFCVHNKKDRIFAA